MTTTLSEEEPRAHACDTPARHSEPDPPARRRVPLPLSLIADRDRWQARAERVGQCSPWHDRPASLAQIEAHTRAGGWIPGEHPWWVELPGYVYGYGFALPLSAVSYAALWVLQRPSRLLIVCVIAALLWLAW